MTIKQISFVLLAIQINQDQINHLKNQPSPPYYSYFHVEKYDIPLQSNAHSIDN